MICIYVFYLFLNNLENFLYIISVLYSKSKKFFRGTSSRNSLPLMDVTSRPSNVRPLINGWSRGCPCESGNSDRAVTAIRAQEFSPKKEERLNKN